MFIIDGGRGMSSIVDVIIDWAQRYYGDAFFLIIAVFAYLYLFFFSKENRIRIIYPVLLLCFVIVNPILYKFIFYRIIYWRLFWMLPNSIAIAYATVRILRNSKTAGKMILLGVIMCIIVLKGTNAFEHGNFLLTQNMYKISDNVIEVCDVILNVDDSPRCIVPGTLYSEVRQYSGDIELMYGRNIEGYINSNIQQEYRDVHAELVKEIPNYDYVLSVARKNGYNFIVVDRNKAIPEDILVLYDYSFVDSYGSLVIYKYVK